MDEAWRSSGKNDGHSGPRFNRSFKGIQYISNGTFAIKDHELVLQKASFLITTRMSNYLNGKTFHAIQEVAIWTNCRVRQVRPLLCTILHGVDKRDKVFHRALVCANSAKKWVQSKVVFTRSPEGVVRANGQLFNPTKGLYGIKALKVLIQRYGIKALSIPT